MALTFSFLFIVGFMLAGSVVYELLRADLDQRLDEAVRGTFSVLAATYGDGDGDLEDLVAAVDSHAGVSPKNQQIFSLVDPAGRRLAGNFTAPRLPGGLLTRSGEALNVRSLESYRAFSGSVGVNVLTVALSFSETESLERLLLLGFGWGTVIISGLAVVGGVLLATGVQRRLDLIAATMVDVSHGHLAARIPLIGRGDDIDEVSSQINAALDRLSALVEGMKHVSANIAHDLKTPLNRLQIILESATEKAERGISAEGELLEASGECARINGTFDAILRIAQIEAGARRARFGDVALNDVVSDIAEAYSEVAADAGMSLEIDRADTRRFAISGDRQLLLQLCSNLVENAIRHCPAGTRIVLGLTTTATEACLSVADDGPGIPADERSNVLQRLYRLEKSRTTSGNGLGLGLVKAIAELHGAKLQLDDNKPGLRVTVTFAQSPSS